jgi:hypothetical protein
MKGFCAIIFLFEVFQGIVQEYELNHICRAGNPGGSSSDDDARRRMGGV